MACLPYNQRRDRLRHTVRDKAESRERAQIAGPGAQPLKRGGPNVCLAWRARGRATSTATLPAPGQHCPSQPASAPRTPHDQQHADSTHGQVLPDSHRRRAPVPGAGGRAPNRGAKAGLGARGHMLGRQVGDSASPGATAGGPVRSPSGKREATNGGQVQAASQRSGLGNGGGHGTSPAAAATWLVCSSSARRNAQAEAVLLDRELRGADGFRGQKRGGENLGRSGARPLSRERSTPLHAHALGEGGRKNSAQEPSLGAEPR